MNSRRFNLIIAIASRLEACFQFARVVVQSAVAALGGPFLRQDKFRPPSQKTELN
jgi:hypothetical protein